MTTNLLDAALVFLFLGYLLLGFAASHRGTSIWEELRGLVSWREWIESLRVWGKSCLND